MFSISGVFAVFFLLVQVFAVFFARGGLLKNLNPLIP